MINNNLAILMAKRKVKISDVSKETKLSRTTLTELYYGREKGILYSTLNTICNYFLCDIEDFLVFSEDEHEKILRKRKERDDLRGNGMGREQGHSGIQSNPKCGSQRDRELKRRQVDDLL